MNQNINEFEFRDGRIAKLICYPAYGNEKGSILILHGMAEHLERYESFASLLSNQGYHAYLYSHRGHGTELTQEELGFFGERNGDQLVINDAIEVLKYIQTQHTNLPLYLMGHSMGSIITRNVIQQFDDLTGVILCGTTNPPLIMTLSGLALCAFTGYKRKPAAKAPIINHMMFNTAAYRKLKKRSNFDWICSDSKKVDEYINDPYCGFVCTKSFYHDLLTLTKHATDKKRIVKTNPKVPFLIISGGQDPVGGFGKDVMNLIRFYQSNGYNVTYKIYEGLRHEILNEPCALDITNDIVQFLDAHNPSLK